MIIVYHENNYPPVIFVLNFFSFTGFGNFDMDFEERLLQVGLEISEKHSAMFNNLLDRKHKNFKKRTKRAYWGFDRLFNDAVRAKNHLGPQLGKLKDTIGTYIEEQSKKVVKY